MKPSLTAQAKRTRKRQKSASTGPKLIGERQQSISLVFNLNDPEQRALYKMLKSAGDVNAFLIRVLKQVHSRIRRVRSRHKTPWTDQVLEQIKREVEQQEEEEELRPIFFPAGKRK